MGDTEKGQPIRVFLKDGFTVLVFEDAASFRALLDDQVGHKGYRGVVDAVLMMRERDAGGVLTGQLSLVGKVGLRFLSKQSVAMVEQIGGTE